MTNYTPFFRKGIFTNNAFKKYRGSAVILAGVFVGAWMDRKNMAQCDSYFNKSMLYGGRELKDGKQTYY
jgi:hypothetical protein